AVLILRIWFSVVLFSCARMTAMTAALAREMITAMMPMTTSSSMMVKAVRAGRPGRGSMAPSLITRAQLPVVEVAEVVAALGRLVAGHLRRPRGVGRQRRPHALDDRWGRALAEDLVRSRGDDLVRVLVEISQQRVWPGAGGLSVGPHVANAGGERRAGFE